MPSVSKFIAKHKVAIKREQTKTCFHYAEREQVHVKHKVAIKQEQTKTCFHYAEREQLHREAVIFNIQYSIFNIKVIDFLLFMLYKGKETTILHLLRQQSLCKENKTTPNPGDNRQPKTLQP